MATSQTEAAAPAALAKLAGAIASLRGWKRAALAIGTGALSVLGFAPFDAWPLLFLTMPVLVWLLDGVARESERPLERFPEKWTPVFRKKARQNKELEPRSDSIGTEKALTRAAFTGWCFGFGFFTAGLYWMGFAFLVDADKFAWMMPFAMTALPAGLALFYAAATAAAAALWSSGTRRIFVLATALFAVEWLRGHILTGFPWNLWGYALTGNDALAQTAALTGVYGLTFLALVIFASPATLGGNAQRNWLLPVLCLALLATGWTWGYLRLANATAAFQPDIRLRIVQGNIPQADKWKPENRRWIFDRLLTLSRNGPEGTPPDTKITHLIWPETSVPFLFMLNGEIAFKDVRDAFATLLPEGRVMVLGAERVEGPRLPDGRVRIEKVYNTLFVLGQDARPLTTYDKEHLVPFGEYVPLEWVLGRIGLKEFAQTHLNAGFASGTTRPPVTTPGAPPFSPTICYEAIFPGQVAGDGARPAWLLNLTNDAWFGVSTGPYQHLQQARLRAIEEGLPLVRAANTGISAVIDPYGRFVASLPLNATGVIDERLPVALQPTPFESWGEMSLIAVALLIFLLYRFVITVE